MLCADSSTLLDPPRMIISLPDGYHRSPNEGKLNLFQARQHLATDRHSSNHSADVNPTLSVLTKHLHGDPATPVSSFLIARGVDVGNSVSDNPDITKYFI